MQAAAFGRTEGQLMDMVLARHRLLQAIRGFFLERGYLEVETPQLVRQAPPDPYIDPLEVHVGVEGPFFLHTSPEVGMKRLVARGYPAIFQICKVFRVEELEEHHNVEFTMLEWYRRGTYLDAMTETAELIARAVDALEPADADYFRQPWPVHDLGPLFRERTGFDPVDLDGPALYGRMKEFGIQGISPEEPWEDLFFRLLVHELEGRLQDGSPYFIKDWPVAISTMAKRKDSGRVERFELYMKQLEIANGYTELLDPTEQRSRFASDNARRQRLGKSTMPVDESFLADLSCIKGSYTGVSVGVDRLLMVLLGKIRIGEVLPLRFTV